MTDRELAAAAWAELTQTTDPWWKWRDRGFPSGTHWSKAKAYQDQIGVAVTPPPPPPPPPPPSTLTKVLFAPMAESALDPVMNTTDAAWKQYVQTHYYRIIKLWGSKWATFYKNGHAYIDSAAIYNPSDIASTHADWILRDSAGKPLYIPWGTKNPDGSYAQYAADQGSPGFRQWIIDRCKAAIATGYVGVHLDDVNLPYSVSGQPYKNGQPLSVFQQKEDICGLLEAVRNALPGAEISHNARWFDSPNHDGVDPFVERQILASDWTTIERGAVDGGLSAGTGTWSFGRLFQYVDHVHSLGRSVVWMSYADSVADTTLNLAAYMLCRENRDMVSSHLGAYPTQPFPPYSYDLGAALGSRTKSGSVWARQFNFGSVSLDELTRIGKVVKV